MTNINTIKRTKKRRASRVTLTLTLFFIISFIFLMMALGNMDSYGDGDIEYVQVKVMYGDSLWSIADEATPEHRDLRKTMYDIIKHNNLESEILRPGQILEVPKVY